MKHSREDIIRAIITLKFLHNRREIPDAPHYGFLEPFYYDKDSYAKLQEALNYMWRRIEGSSYGDHE